MVQRIYYPGFTVAGGVGELPGIVATAVAVALTDVGSVDFVLRTVALVALVGVQAVYWLSVHLVNRFWIEGEDLGSFGPRLLRVRCPPSGRRPRRLRGMDGST